MALYSLESDKKTVVRSRQSYSIGLGFLISAWSALTLLGVWRRRVRARRQLFELDDHMLADIGLTRQDVVNEAANPFWRPVAPGSGRL